MLILAYFSKIPTTLIFFHKSIHQCYWDSHPQPKGFVVYVYLKKSLSFNNLGYQTSTSRLYNLNYNLNYIIDLNYNSDYIIYKLKQIGPKFECHSIL
jgi:hypothetical protein